MEQARQGVHREGGHGPGARGVPGAPARAPVEELIDYLWGSPQAPPLLFRTSGFAVSVPSPPWPERSPPPLPRGVVHLYPRYLVFAASNHSTSSRPGGSTLAPLAIDAFARLPVADRERLARPLRAPESRFVPIAEMIAVRGERWLGAPCIELTSRAGVLRLGGLTTGATLVPASTLWEPRLLAKLREMIAAPL